MNDFNMRIVVFAFFAMLFLMAADSIFKRNSEIEMLRSEGHLIIDGLITAKHEIYYCSVCNLNK